VEHPAWKRVPVNCEVNKESSMSNLEKRASELISKSCHNNPLVPGKTAGPWAGMPLDKAVVKLRKIDEELKAERDAIAKAAHDEDVKARAHYPKRTAADWAYIRRLKKLGVIKG